MKRVQKRISRVGASLLFAALPLYAYSQSLSKAQAQPMPGGVGSTEDGFDGPPEHPRGRPEGIRPDGPRPEGGGPGLGSEEGGPGGNRRGRFQERLRRFQERMNNGEGGGQRPGDGGEGGRPFAAAHGAKGMSNYMQFVDGLVHSVQDSQTAIGLAAIGIRDAYKKQGKALDSIPVFQELLANTKDQKERNIYLFLVRQTYKEANDLEKFLEVSRQIIKENQSK